MTIPEILDMLPEPEEGTSIDQALDTWFLLQKLTPEQWLRMAEMLAI